MTSAVPDVGSVTNWADEEVDENAGWCACCGLRIWQIVVSLAEIIFVCRPWASQPMFEPGLQLFTLRQQLILSVLSSSRLPQQVSIQGSQHIPPSKLSSAIYHTTYSQAT